MYLLLISVDDLMKMMLEDPYMQFKYLDELISPLDV